MTLAYVLFALAGIGTAHAWAWRRALRREKHAAAAYFGWTLLAALWPVALLFGIIGLEEVLGGTLLPERLPLVTGMLLVLGLIAAPVGAAAVAWLRHRSRR